MTEKIYFVVIFLARVISMPKNIDNMTKNKWLKFQRPVSNTLDFIQTYVGKFEKYIHTYILGIV